MKIETLLLIAAAGVAGYVLHERQQAKAKAAAPSALPTTTPNIVIEEYDVYDYGPWGYGYPYPYPRPWGGARGGGGRHHHHRGGHR